MLQIATLITFNNEYNFKLIGPDGKIKQEVTCHNIILDKFWERQRMSHPYTGWVNHYPQQGTAPSGLWLGSGTGTPAVTDTSLFSSLWVLSSANARSFNISADGRTGEALLTYIFPANSSYVGTITEAGLTMCWRNGDYGQDNVLVTHCLLTDAEGNPISIVKTDNDKLEVTVAWRVVVPDEYNHFKFYRADEGYLVNMWKEAGARRDYSIDGLFYACNLNLGLNEWSYQPGYTTTAVTFTNISRTATTDPQGVNFGAQRVNADVGNNHYFKRIEFTGVCNCVLPNHDVFPPYKLEDISLGVGDGSTTVYTNPFNYFMADTDIIYIDGVALTRGVDYTIEAFNNGDRLDELSAGSSIKSQKAGQGKVYSSYLYNYYPFRAKELAYTKYNSVTDQGFYYNVPYEIEFNSVQKINNLTIPALTHVNGSNYNITLKIEYSTNGEDYTELLTTPAYNSGSGYTPSISLFEAKYMRFTIMSQSGGDTTQPFRCYTESSTGWMGYVGNKQIVFTNPPAAGAKITMEVQMDLPFKNDNYVIDLSASVHV